MGIFLEYVIGQSERAFHFRQLFRVLSFLINKQFYCLKEFGQLLT